MIPFCSMILKIRHERRGIKGMAAIIARMDQLYSIPEGALGGAVDYLARLRLRPMDHNIALVQGLLKLDPFVKLSGK
uniref:Uncharacterized protein n=1 Tax=Candidatus Kentrum sp. LPFa TaxID=2126335 RepID=A0A450WTN6_9GAMM|nr:MAG: hypothetical protein BECKLPF1236B_GA0070989_12084 [Candidatus Kentron sp. LPFa]